ATGLPHPYFDELPTMFDPAAGDAALFIYNPTDTTSRMYAEDQKGLLGPDEGDDPDPDRKSWHRFRLSVLDHPNLAAEMRGEPLPFPGAVNLRMVGRWVRDGCEPVAPADKVATDIEWPPGSGAWHRPGPWFQARGLGLWPDSGSGVWTDALWEACLRGPRPSFPLETLPQVGCDTATGKGEDYHAIHGRWGSVSVCHSTSNTMTPERIFARLKEATRDLADLANRHRDRGSECLDPKDVPIKIDDDGMGNAVGAFLMQDGYTVHLIGAGTSATRPDRYPRKRDELWFEVAERARAGGVYLGGLDRATLRRLKQQLLAPAWDLDGQGRRKVEPKDDSNEKIGRSPDD